jgi:plastocyanin
MVKISLPCPIAEVSKKDLSGQLDVHVTISMGELSFYPTWVKVQPGALVTVTLDNTTSPFPHNFTIDSLSVRKTIASGHKATATFTLPSSGPVRFYCSLHIARGMQGAFYFS